MNLRITNKLTNFLAGIILIIMLCLGFFSLRNDSATMDELSHIPAGYSYITQQDMRINPEHPPLLKDLAGASAWLGSKLTAIPINFPRQAPSWQIDINGQWDFGATLLYKSGNDVDNIILWARLPMLLIMLVLGVYVFKWTRELYGNRAGLLALILYSFSPTILAHGRLVTTDLGATAAFFISVYYLIKWLKNQTLKNLITAGVVFGVALLVKFSIELLIPYFIILVIVWTLINIDYEMPVSYKYIFMKLGKNLLLLLLIGIIGLIVVWPVYQYHVLNYPAERQHVDTEYTLRSFSFRPLANLVIWMSDKPLVRPYGQFMLGLLMVMQRAVGGNTTYFLGEISAAGWHYYFPLVFLMKEQLASLILTLIALFSAALSIKPLLFKKPFNRIGQWVKNHFTEFALLLLFVIYWASSVKSNLNIGVRHVLPTIPLLYVLVSGQIIQWLKIPFTEMFQDFRNSLGKTITTTAAASLKTYSKYLIVLILIIWYVISAFRIYPSFLAFFNELFGGPNNGYKYVTDSNLDWGQDLKRLTQYVAKNNIDKIYVDYFGGGSPQYYLGDKFLPWWGDRNPNDLKPGDYLAISATFLQGGRGKPAPGFTSLTGYYRWLNDYEPITTIGHSIFVYQIK